MKTDNNNNNSRGKSDFSVTSFLRNVFVEELVNDSGRDHKLIVTAVHAVFLESGFVAVTDGLRAAWPSPVFSLSLFYTLPEIATSSAEDRATVVLKFQTLGTFLNVYGSLVCERGTTTRSVRLNEDELVPFLNVVWADCRDIDGFSDHTSSEKQVFQFWKSVKDNLALPLLIDICDKAGLPLPPCFMRLPADLKLKILELLPGVELAKVCCVCSELQHLAVANDDLWKLRLDNEFGNGNGMDKVQGSWKRAFKRVWMMSATGFRVEKTLPPWMMIKPRTRYRRARTGVTHDPWLDFGNDITRPHIPTNHPQDDLDDLFNFLHTRVHDPSNHLQCDLHDFW